MALNLRSQGEKREKEATQVQQVESAKQEAIKDEAKTKATTPVYADGILCSKSDKLAFVAPLGDPSHPDVTTDKDGNKNVTPYIVGYRFKALEDMEVPECGLADDAKKNLMSFKDKNGKKVVKAGEIFDLTRFETGLLLAAPEFNGKVTGEGKSFTAVYQSNVVKSKSGTLGDASAATEVPTVALKTDVGSIKDYKIIEVLTFTTETLENGTKRKNRTIVPGFEKWEPLCRAQVARTRTEGSGSSAKVTRNAKAEAFLQIVAKK